MAGENPDKLILLCDCGEGAKLLVTKKAPPKEFGSALRKDRDSNPGNPKGLTVFETAPIDHSGIFPVDWQPLVSQLRVQNYTILPIEPNEMPYFFQLFFQR